MRSMKEKGQNPSAPIGIKSHEKVNHPGNGFFLYQCEKRGLDPCLSLFILDSNPDLETFSDLLRLVEGSE